MTPIWWIAWIYMFCKAPQSILLMTLQFLVAMAALKMIRVYFELVDLGLKRITRLAPPNTFSKTVN